VLIVLLVAIGGVILIAAGPWPWGLVAVLAAALALFARHGRERIDAGRTISIARARALSVREAMAARSREQVELFRARRELAELEAQLARAFHDLGRSVFHGDTEGKKAAQAGADDLAARISDTEAEIETLRQQTEQRVRQAQAAGQATVRLETPPEPARIPEPYPPDEITPPAPAPTPPPVPEPTPAPEPPSLPEEPVPPQPPGVPDERAEPH
jgi:outer membrane biosynthesis protein TonB